MCNCKCNCKNGSDMKDFLLESEVSGVYAFGLTHYTCGNRKMSLNDPAHPILCNLNIEPVGDPVNLGNGIYCQEILISGTVTYRPCGSCRPEPEYVTWYDCITCTSATQPKLALGEVNANPKPITYYINNGCECCRAQKPCTNQIAITTSIEVTSAAGA